MRKDKRTPGDGPAEIDGNRGVGGGCVVISREGTEKTELLRQHDVRKSECGENRREKKQEWIWVGYG